MKTNLGNCFNQRVNVKRLLVVRGRQARNCAAWAFSDGSQKTFPSLLTPLIDLSAHGMLILNIIGYFDDQLLEDLPM